MVADNQWNEYYKRTTVIAMRIETAADVLEAQACGAPVHVAVTRPVDDGGFTVKTDSGNMTVAYGGWLLKSPDGRYWPTDDSYFRDSYDMVRG